MDKFSALRAFTSVVEEGGFAAAARKTGASRSAVNRLVIQLEDALGVQLLNRTTRKVSPTADGRAFFERGRAILTDLEEAERDLAKTGDEAMGQLRVNAPMSFGTLHLGPAVADFMADHPKLRIDLQLNDRFVDIVAEGFDVALRIAEPLEDTTLVDLRICDVRRVLCASPDFLNDHGAPTAPGDLRELPCLHYGPAAKTVSWRLTGPVGPVRVGVHPVLWANNGEVLRDAAVAGLGVCSLPTFIVGSELQAGRLVTVLPEYAPSELTLAAVYPTSRHLSPKLRLFTDFLLDRFGSQPYWDLIR
ncbi:MAG: LysR substrate-binding domain-containing protein [Bauldia litoralis]